eukprot:6214123-Pleurochrysis_carterae.AAC.1
MMLCWKASDERTSIAFASPIYLDAIGWKAAAINIYIQEMYEPQHSSSMFFCQSEANPPGDARDLLGLCGPARCENAEI